MLVEQLETSRIGKDSIAGDTVTLWDPNIRINASPSRTAMASIIGWLMAPDGRCNHAATVIEDDSVKFDVNKMTPSLWEKLFTAVGITLTMTTVSMAALAAIKPLHRTCRSNLPLSQHPE